MKLFQLIVHLRSGGEIIGQNTDVTNLPDYALREALTQAADFVKQFPKMSYLSLKMDKGTAVIHPDDISFITLRGTTDELNDLINEVM